MKKIIAFLVLAGILFQSSCAVISLIATPTSHEKKIPAEYDLTERQEQKILVLVNQPGWLASGVNLRYYLTRAIHYGLTEKIEFLPENIVDYNKLSEFRSNRSDFALLSAQEVGKALGADIVLVVTVEDYQLNLMPEAKYYDGSLSAAVALVDTASGEKLWPDSAESKPVYVGIDIEPNGRRVAIGRLAGALAHCTVRHLYGCTVAKFKIAEDRSGINWED